MQKDTWLISRDGSKSTFTGAVTDHHPSSNSAGPGSGTGLSIHTAETTLLVPHSNSAIKTKLSEEIETFSKEEPRNESNPRLPGQSLRNPESKSGSSPFISLPPGGMVSSEPLGESTLHSPGRKSFEVPEGDNNQFANKALLPVLEDKKKNAIPHPFKNLSKPILGRYVVKRWVQCYQNIYLYEGEQLGAAPKNRSTETAKGDPVRIWVEPLSKNLSFPTEIHRGSLPDLPQPKSPYLSLDEHVRLLSTQEIFFEETPPVKGSSTTTLEESVSLWPHLEWRYSILSGIRTLILPRCLEFFDDQNYRIYIEEIPQGIPLIEWWQQAAIGHDQKWLVLLELTQLLDHFQSLGIWFGSVRVTDWIVTPTGQLSYNKPVYIFPIPLPKAVLEKESIIKKLDLPPEAKLKDYSKLDDRSELYRLGLLMISLLLGRELEEKDFTPNGVIAHPLDTFSDLHPGFARLLARCCAENPEERVPGEVGHHQSYSLLAWLEQSLAELIQLANQRHLEIAGWTTTGMMRASNEDAFSIRTFRLPHREGNWEQIYAVLADGMGGMESGEVASSLAVQGANEYFDKNQLYRCLNPIDVDIEVAKKHLFQVMNYANELVVIEAEENKQHQGMGCTLEVLWCCGNRALIGHIGDSRIYLVREGQLKLLTEDQTLVGFLHQAGFLTAEEVLDHPQRNELYQAIGRRENFEPYVQSFELQLRDRILICSDGLSNQLTENRIFTILKKSSSPEKAARRLINVANRLGATDNVTAIVLFVS